MSPLGFPFGRDTWASHMGMLYPLGFRSWAQHCFQLGLPPYSMPGWPSWLPNSWAGIYSLITAFMASVTLWFMRVMIEMSPLITSTICAGLAFPTPSVHWQSSVFPWMHIFPTGGSHLALLAKDEQLLLGLKCFQKKTRPCIQCFHLKNRSFPVWMFETRIIQALLYSVVLSMSEQQLGGGVGLLSIEEDADNQNTADQRHGTDYKCYRSALEPLNRLAFLKCLPSAIYLPCSIKWAF